jgi:chromosome segregation ATPase
MNLTSPSSLFAGLLTLALAAPAVAATPNPPTTQQTLSQSFDAISTTLERAKNQVTEAVAERDKATEELAAARRMQAMKDRRIAELEKQLAEGRKQNDGLKKRVGELETTSEEWRRKAQEQARQLEIGAGAQQRLGQFRNRLEATMQEFGALETELSELRKELKGPRDMAALMKANEGLKVELASANRRLESAAASTGKLKKENEDSLRQLAAEKKAVLESREREQELRQSLQEVGMQREKQITMQRVELDHARHQLAELDKKLDTVVQALEQERAAAAGKLKGATTQIEQLRKESASRQQQLAEQERQLAAADRHRKELAGAVEQRERQVAELRKQLEARKQQDDKP